MKFAVVEPSQQLLDWIGEKIQSDDVHVAFDPAVTRCTVLFDDDMNPVIATALDGWSRYACDGCIASDGSKRWSRVFIEGTYKYVFETMGLNRLSMIVSSTNTHALRMHKALGHVQEGVHRDYFGPGKDAISFSFLRDDWLKSRWAPKH